MSDQDLGTLIHDGTLVKSPPESKSKDLSRWKKRYFKLWSSKKLEYFKSRKSEKPIKKPIDLNRCKSIDGGLRNKKWEYIFCINTDYRKYYLVAKTHQCMNEWIEKICDICGFSEQVSMSPVETSSPSKFIFDSPLIQKTRFAAERPIEFGTSPQSNQEVPGDLLSYDKELPPLPNSSSSSDLSSREGDSTSPQPLSCSPFGSSHIKQSKADSPSCYDMVPTPRPAPGSLPGRGSPQESRLFCPAESALKNMTIHDESYVDMQADNGNQELQGNNHVNSLTSKQSSYDTVPPPRPVVGDNFSNYDLVPKPRQKNDEYISCNFNGREFQGDGGKTGNCAPPVPDQTYSGFDMIPNEERLFQKPTRSSERDINKYGEPSIQGSGNDIYDVPPTGSFTQMIYDTPPSLKNDFEAQSCGDSIYDSPPIHEPKEEPSGRSGGVQNRGYLSDSVYDTPPPFQDQKHNDDSIYDTPPTCLESEARDNIYDMPPRSEVSHLPDIGFNGLAQVADPINSPADLFNFGFSAPPKVDRSLKYSSTGELEMNRNMPPPVDRKTRPVLTASVPLFSSDVEKSNMASQVSEARSDSQLGSDSIYDCPPRPLLGVLPDNVARKNSEKAVPGSGASVYSSVDPRLTAAIQNVRR